MAPEQSDSVVSNGGEIGARPLAPPTVSSSLSDDEGDSDSEDGYLEEAVESVVRDVEV